MTSAAERKWNHRPWAALWLSLAILAAPVVIYGLIWYGPDVIARHDIGNGTGPLQVVRVQQARDAARGRLLTLGAGVFAAGALLFTGRNYRVARQTLEITEQGQRRTLELTEQGQVTDRYTRAIEQLGSEKLDVRIGGIYALERVARDSAKDHPTVMEVVSAFVREHSHEQWPPSDRGGREQARSTRPDVQAAVTVVGRRIAKSDIQGIDLGGADLRRANLTGANLTGANLTDADFRRANLTGANLTGANLTDADFRRANLTGANLTGANLFFTDLGRANLFGADLTDADLDHADLTRANLTDARLPGADLDGANLTDAYLARANLTGADLTGARLTRADLVLADFTNAHLTGARLRGADLRGADLRGADLIAADLRGAGLRGADLRGADLGISSTAARRADLTDADLTAARWPRDAAAPAGWKLDTSSGRLEAAGTNSGPTEAN